MRTELTRSGRRIAIGAATQLQDGKETVWVTAALSDLAAVILDLGEIGSATIDLSVHVRGRPAPGWLGCRVSTRFVIDGYHEEDFEIWDSTGRLVAESPPSLSAPVLSCGAPAWIDRIGTWATSQDASC